MKTEDKLHAMMEEIKTSENERARLEGEQDSLVKRLKDEHGCSSVKEASKKVEQMRSQIGQLDEEIEDGIRQLEEDYEWAFSN